ncbi:hypothetical protein P872_09485 [Rhodonellum psychrophilum GCM71 = DSM 17998]|uniref:Uncharacterized protein n=1 Tax=Rhodonellum psychrophilum GCM71 = DSM 17998 TaxID=1123057 RepID=U5BZP0_9BACT|nr:hypothetical protein P872_09485 [Rhodonellum psychrophilum GCM71 = DSM 17998]
MHKTGFSKKKRCASLFKKSHWNESFMQRIGIKERQSVA